MFWFDKDMERVMLAKKKEVLQEIETAKKRVLHELYCLKRSAHSDLCSLQADYNRMALTLTNTVNEIRAELKCITDEYKSMIATTFNQYTTTIENKLLALETFENEVIKEVNDKLSELDTMKAQVEALIAEMEQIVADGVTEADLAALKEELLVAMENAGAQADWNENDETNKSFVKNRTHYRLYADYSLVFVQTTPPNVTNESVFNPLITLEEVTGWKRFLFVRNAAYYAGTDADGSSRTLMLEDIVVDSGYIFIDGAKIDESSNDNVNVLAEITLDGIISARFEWKYNTSYKRFMLYLVFTTGESVETGCGVLLASYSLHTKTLDPAYLANGYLPGYVLKATANDTMEWVEDNILVSPGGTKYKLTVSDDGVLSATPVTE